MDEKNSTVFYPRYLPMPAMGEAGEGGAPPAEEGPKEEPKTEPKEEPKTFDEAYVKTLREEAKANRIGKKESDDKLAKLQGDFDAIKKNLGVALGYEKLEGNEDLVKGAEDKIKRSDGIAKTALLRAEFLLEATKAGLNPDYQDDAFKIIDLSAASVDLATMKVDGIADIIKEFKEKRPLYFGTAAPRSAGNGGEPPRDEKVEPTDIVRKLASDIGQPPELIMDLYKKHGKEGETIEGFIKRKYPSVGFPTKLRSFMAEITKT